MASVHALVQADRSWPVLRLRTSHGAGALDRRWGSSRRLLTLCYEHPPLGGGGGRVARTMAEQLGEFGFTTDFVTMAPPGLPAAPDHPAVEIHAIDCNRGDPVVCSPQEMLPYVGRAFVRARQLVATNRPELSLSHFILPDGITCLALRAATGLPYLLVAHGSDVPGYNPHRFKALHRLLGPLWRLVVDNAECILCPSQTVERLVRTEAPEARTAVVPNGIDVDRFDPARPRQDRILAVTRMLERKGVQYLIEALAGLDRPFPLHVVGDGPYLPALRGLAASRGIPVVFHGALANGSPELRELYETSRIFALPSTMENFPMVLLEAMAAGSAILTTAGTGCAEVVGDCAELVSAADVGATRAALARLISDPVHAARLGEAGRRRVESRFDLGVVARRYAELIDTVARSGRGRAPAPRPAMHSVGLQVATWRPHDA